jgi:hypothetical protein
MLGAIMLISYGLISVIGSVAILIKGSAKSASGCIYFFLLGHVTLLVIAIYDLFTPLHFLWFIFGCIICLVSRWLNGKFVFRNNNWLHYFIVAGIFAVAYALT